MRILKYILLLILLFLIGLTVFIITQKGDYSISRTKVITTKKAVVYNYVNDYQNWESFASWVEENGKTQFVYPTISSGKGAKCIWSGSSNGSLKTIDLKENLFIRQKINFNGSDIKSTWIFKDTIGKTKVTWRAIGTMNVSMKIKAFLNGGIENIIGDIFEKTLHKLDKIVDIELNTHTINVNGIVYKPKTYYIAQNITSKKEKVAKNIKILIPKIIQFFEKHKIVMHGKPIVIFNKEDEIAQTVNLSVGIPIKDSVKIKAGYNLICDKIEGTPVVKTTLMGDYSHLTKANQKTLDYLFEKGIKRNFLIPNYTIYTLTFLDQKQPSKWKTELFYPVFSANFDKKPTVQTDVTNSIEN